MRRYFLLNNKAVNPQPSARYIFSFSKNHVNRLGVAYVFFLRDEMKISGMGGLNGSRIRLSPYSLMASLVTAASVIPIPGF